MSKLNYKTSKDYKRLKELLDKGHDIICVVPYDCTFDEATDVCHARSRGDGAYSVSARGIEYGSYWPGMKRFASFEEMCERIRLEFIEPNGEDNV